VADVNPSAGGATAVVAGERESWTLTLIKVGGPVLAAILILVSSIISLALPDRMPSWMSALPILAGLDAAIIAAAFGGPVLKRAQEAKAAEK
jgi:hypothetical protein